MCNELGSPKLLHPGINWNAEDKPAMKPLYSSSQNGRDGDSPFNDPAVKTPGFHCRGPESSISDQGTKIPTTGATAKQQMAEAWKENGFCTKKLVNKNGNP